MPWKQNRLKTLCTAENIARFARFIRKADGYPVDRDIENWLEAEALLRGDVEPRFLGRQKPIVVFMPG